jgi:hypothetical protein
MGGLPAQQGHLAGCPRLVITELAHLADDPVAGDQVLNGIVRHGISDRPQGLRMSNSLGNRLIGDH